MYGNWNQVQRAIFTVGEIATRIMLLLVVVIGVEAENQK